MSGLRKQILDLPHEPTPAGADSIEIQKAAGGAGSSRRSTLAEAIATAGALAGWTSALNTTAPNDTIFAASLVATGSATDIDAVIEPKGAGAFQLQIADNTTTGGNKRGKHAIDSQTQRNDAAQVASGDYSTVTGANNKASGTQSCGMGYSNSATGSHSSAMGANNIAYGGYDSALGTNNYSNSAHASAIGYNNFALYAGAAAVGARNRAEFGAGSAIGNGNKTYGNLNSAIGTNNSTGYAAESSAIGSRNTSIGARGNAIGNTNHASGTTSNAIGTRNYASGDGSNAVGYNNTASYASASAMGTHNTASATGSNAVGINNSASGANSSAFGYKNAVSGTYSSAFGALLDDGGFAGVTMLGHGDTATVGGQARLSNTNGVFISPIDASTITGAALGVISVDTVSKKPVYYDPDTASMQPIGSEVPPNVATETASYTETATSGMQCRRLDATAGSIVVNLPTAVGNTAIFRFKRPVEDVSGNTVTVTAFGGELIDGSPTATFAAPDSADLISNGVNWDVY